MKESGYYPIGTEYDPNAPWNDTIEEKDSIEKSVEVSISLCNTVTIVTDDYIEEEDVDVDYDIDDEGNKITVANKYTAYDFSNTVWENEYEKDDCFILNLLKEYGVILKKQIDSLGKTLDADLEEYHKKPNKRLGAIIQRTRNQLRVLTRKYKACNDYSVVDLVVYEA